MATAADPGNNNHSPRSSGISGDGLNSPQFRRNAKSLPSPWANIVRGGESEAVPAAPSSPSSSSPIAPREGVIHSDGSPMKASSSFSPDNSSVEAQPESSDNGNSNAARAKKPAWNKPSNGAVEVGPVMGADSWPALSESTKPSAKSSSDSLKSITDGSASVSQRPVIASSPQKQATSTANPNPTSSPAFPVRPKSKRSGGGGGGGLANGGVIQQQPLPSPPVMEMPQNSSGKPGPATPESSSARDPSHKNNNWESGSKGGFPSQAHAGNDHPQQRNSFRRGNGGSHPRGEGTYHGGRRDHDRGNHEWNSHRSVNGRDVHMQQQRVIQRGYTRPPPPNPAPFIGPPQVRPFGVGFHEMGSSVYYLHAPLPDAYRGVPFVTHAPHHPVFFPTVDPQLRALIVNQIDYYFSNENLIKDTFLREKMDEQGWVPITLIASFNRVKQLTTNIQIILDAVRTSTVVEVQGDKVRKRNEWQNWIMPPNQIPVVSDPQSPSRTYNTLASRIQGVTLEENTKHSRSNADPHSEVVLNRSSSAELNSQSQTPNGEETSQINVQADSDLSIPAGNLSKNESC